MAEAVTAGADTLLSDLPDEIVIWEILVRLDPKSLLRCRAVRRAWRRATSAGSFLVAHHARQPALLIATGDDEDDISFYRSILTFDHRAADAQLQHVIRLEVPFSRVEASCDGLLLLRSHDPFPYEPDGAYFSLHGPYYDPDEAYFSMHNPATRQCARLPIPSDMIVYGMYPHHPTGEYRILLYEEGQGIDVDACYIFAVGSVQPPRNIRWQEEAGHACYGKGEAVLLHGSLHWSTDQLKIGSNSVVVFDTTTESFRAMRSPVAPFIPCYNHLFDMDGVLGMYSHGDAATTIDIWVLPDYESEIWTLKCKIELPVTEITGLCGRYPGSTRMVVLPGNGELFVLARIAEWVLQLDMDGQLVATFHRNEVVPTQLKLKETLIPQPFFPRQDGKVVKAPSLI